MLTFLLVHVLEGLGVQTPPFLDWAAPAVASVLGLAAVLYTAFAWPGEMDAQFFDSKTSDSPGFGSGFTMKATYSAGLGWYFGILGTIVAPIVASIVGARAPSMESLVSSASGSAPPAAPVAAEPALASPPAPVIEAPAPTVALPVVRAPRIAVKRTSSSSAAKKRSS